MYSGRKIKYQRKYCEVQTLLKVTKAKVCANRVVGKSFLAQAKGINSVLRRSWGTNANDSNLIEDEVVLGEEERYKRGL